MLKRKIAASGVSLLAAATLTAGCANAQSNNVNHTAATSSIGSARTVSGTFKVGLVTDTGGLNDHGFNNLAYLGLQKAEKDFGVHGDVVQSKSSNDYVPNLTRFAQQGYNLVIAVGYLMHDQVEQVAKAYPKTKFLIIDSEVTDRKNVTSALFKTEQCGYLVGVMAGLMEKSKSIPHLNSQNVVGVVGGMSIPPVNSYIAGFQQGIKKTDPGAKVEVKYAGNFTDQALGSNLAQSEISDGADIIFQVAGGVGIGVIHAAQSAKVYAIGVDADQNYLAKDTVITSALKGVDTATYDVIKETKQNQFKSGDQFFDLSNNGVGIGIVNSAVPKSIIAQVNKYAAQIKVGKIKVSPNMSK